MGCSPPGYIRHGILQARILGWVAIPFSRGSSWPRDQTRVTCIAGRFFYCLSHQGNPTISKVSLNFLAPWRTETEGPRMTPLCWCPYQCDEGGYTLLYTTPGTFVSMISLTSHHYDCLHFTKGLMEVKSLSWLAQGPPAVWLQTFPVLAWASFLPRFFPLNDLSTPTPPIILPYFFLLLTHLPITEHLIITNYSQCLVTFCFVNVCLSSWICAIA